MNKVTVLLTLGLLSSSLNCLDNEIPVQELVHEEKKDQHYDVNEKSIRENCSKLVDSSSHGADYPILDGIEKSFPNVFFKPLVVLILYTIKQAHQQSQNYKKRYNRLKEIVICNQNQTEQKMAQLTEEIERLKHSDQEKQKLLEQLKAQNKQNQQIIHSMAKREIVGG